jgi:hypothetical protein
MKTSKIIFICLIGAFALLILVAAIDVRIIKSRHNLNSASLKVNRQLLPVFKVLVINGSDLNLTHADSSYFKITCHKDSLMRQLNYTIKGDTLTISDINRLHRRNNYPSIELTTSDSLKSIICKNSGLTFTNYNWMKMNFNIDKSYLWLNRDKKFRSSLTSLNILATNHSNINSDKFKIENISLNLLKSEASLEIFADRITGALSDSSRIDVRYAGEISLKSDSTSTLNINY